MSDSLHSVVDGGRSLLAPTLFGELEPATQQSLRESAPRRHYDGGAIISHRGETSTGFWLIESGRVTVGQFQVDGSFRALAVLGAGDSYGELAVFSGRRRVVDAVARGPADLRWIDRANFEAALAADPPSMRRMLGALSEELQEMLDVISGLRRGTASARIAGVLANLAGKSDRAIDVGQAELGELTGVSRVTANKVLASLEQMGLIQRGYGTICVLDREGLLRFSRG